MRFFRTREPERPTKSDVDKLWDMLVDCQRDILKRGEIMSDMMTRHEASRERIEGLMRSVKAVQDDLAEHQLTPPLLCEDG